MNEIIEFIKMKQIRQLTFGCSHTQNHYLRQKERWTSVANEMNEKLDFHNFGVNSAGFAFMYYLAKELTKTYIIADRVTHVVLQKPQPIRLVWWRKEHPVDVYHVDKTPIEKLRKKCDKIYRQQTKNKKLLTQFGNTILHYEIEILNWFKELFPNAKFAYYYHWADEIHTQLISPILTHYLKNLGKNAEILGMTNLGSIINAEDIPGVYDEEGDIIWDVPRIYKSGWTVFPNDVHPSSKLQIEVAKKVVNWSENL